MTDSVLFTWVLLPLLIFLSRIADQSIGTLRLIFLSKGMKIIAPILGFFEVIIWLIAVKQIIQHVDNWVGFVAYGAGFATGNYIGITLDEKLKLGHVMLRVFPRLDSSELLSFLRENNYGYTIANVHGSKGDGQIIMCIVKRKYVDNIIDAVNKFNPNAFYTIEEVKSLKHGVFRKEAKYSPVKTRFQSVKKIK